MPTLNRKSVAHGLQRALGTSAQLILKGGCPPPSQNTRENPVMCKTQGYGPQTDG